MTDEEYDRMVDEERLSTIQRLEAEAARLREFYNAWQRCESGRGCYSCTEAHDCRCPKDRGLGECACGRDRLMAAEAALEGER